MSLLILSTLVDSLVVTNSKILFLFIYSNFLFSFYKHDKIVKRSVEYNQYLTLTLWRNYVDQNKDLWPFFPTIVRKSECENHKKINEPKDVNEDFYIAVIIIFNDFVDYFNSS